MLYFAVQYLSETKTVETTPETQSSQREAADLLLLQAGVQQDRIIVDGIGMEGVDSSRLLVQYLRPGDICASLSYINVVELYWARPGGAIVGNHSAIRR